MDITELYNAIIKRLKEDGYEDIIAELNNLLAGAATGSEGLFLTGKYLFDLKNNNSTAYKIIENLIEGYLKYCNQNGVIIN